MPVLLEDLMVPFRSIPFQKLDQFPSGSPPPSYAKVLEMNFEPRTNAGGVEELWFYFSQWTDYIDLGAYGGIKKLIDDVCAPGYTFGHSSPTYPRTPYASPLSLHNDRLSYIIYKLSGKNWQFARRGYPITVGANGDDKKFCFNAFRVPPSGYNDQDEGTPFDSTIRPEDGHRVAYFISDGEGARADSSDDQYDNSINLHVDMLYTGPPARRIPIMLDPDVRYPGGSA